MKVGLVGPTYVERSLPFDAQRTVNFFPVLDQFGKEVSALYGTPGLINFATLPLDPSRGIFKPDNNRVFYVTGNTLYEVFSDGTFTSRGTLLTSNGHVYIEQNATQLFICDKQYGYIFKFSDNSFARVTDPDFPASVGWVTYIDGYFIVGENNTNKFYLSALNDGFAWNALDFASAESSPDYLLRGLSVNGELWLFGERTTEVWVNTGDSAFPFQRTAGGKIEMGVLAPPTAVSGLYGLLWVGRDENGNGIVYQADGFTPIRVSNPPIERAISRATDSTDIRAWVYQEDGTLFYVLNGGGLATSLVYDLTTKQWHERAYLNGEGNFEQHLGIGSTFAFGKNLVIDRRYGRIYDMSLNYYSDAGDEIASERTFTHISDENKNIRFNSLEIALESGVGLLTGQGTDPQISLEISKDGGRTWSSKYMTTMGKIGQYGVRACWRRLGIADNMTFRVRITDPVKRVLIGSYVNA